MTQQHSAPRRTITGKRRSKSKWIVGGVVITAAVVALSFLSLGENLVYFYTPAEALAKSGELDGSRIKVGGMVVPGTVDWRPEELSLAFTMSDLKGHEIKVRHRGTPPDMFKEGQGVVVDGRISGGEAVMVSQHLMVKHSEEYKKPDDHSSMDRTLLQESMFKNEDI